MAKVNAPLLSLSAAGALGKTIVAATWKGIKYMRQYVTPSNPKSTDQVAQRTIFSTVVDHFHDANFTAADKVAYNTRATKTGKRMSGFNLFCRIYIDALVAALTVFLFYDIAAEWSAGGKTVNVTGDSNAISTAFDAYFYDKQGKFLGTEELTTEADKSIDDTTVMTFDAAPYYCMLKSADGSLGGSTGYIVLTSGA